MCPNNDIQNSALVELSTWLVRSDSTSQNSAALQFQQLKATRYVASGKARTGCSLLTPRQRGATALLPGHQAVPVPGNHQSSGQEDALRCRQLPDSSFPHCRCACSTAAYQGSPSHSPSHAVVQCCVDSTNMGFTFLPDWNHTGGATLPAKTTVPTVPGLGIQRRPNHHNSLS